MFLHYINCPWINNQSTTLSSPRYPRAASFMKLHWVVSGRSHPLHAAHLHAHRDLQDGLLLLLPAGGLWSADWRHHRPCCLLLGQGHPGADGPVLPGEQPLTPNKETFSTSRSTRKRITRREMPFVQIVRWDFNLCPTLL